MTARRTLWSLAILATLVACLDMPVAPEAVVTALGEARCAPDDAYEENDTPESATTVALGTLRALICRTGSDTTPDLDFYTLRGTADSGYRAWLDASPLATGKELRLFDAATGDPVATAVDGNIRMPKSGRLLASVRLCCVKAGDSLSYALLLSDKLNRAPLAPFEWTPARPVAGRTVTLTSKATDPDGDALGERRWALGDGRTATGVTVTTAWPARGRYTLRHIVADQWGRADSTSQEITVDPDVARIDVTPATAELPSIGDSLILTAVARDPAGAAVSDVAFVWTTSDAAVATVNANGLVEARANGTAQISAAAYGRTGTSTVTVKQKITRVVLSPVSLQFGTLGRTAQLAARAEDARRVAVAGVSVAWASSDAAVATVDATGLVTARRAGRATVTASVGTTSAAVEVVVAPVVASVDVNPSAGTLVSVNDSLQLTAIPKDTAGAPVVGATVTWSSAALTVATVDATGLVIAKANGVAQVSAVSGGITGTASITVRRVAATLAVAPSTLRFVVIGRSASLTASAADARGTPMTDAGVTWSSTNAAVASVDAAGVVTARGAGAATITAASGALTATVGVVVAPLVATITVSPSSATLTALTDSVQMTAVAKDSLGNVLANTPFAWSTDAPTVATVASTGWVYPVADGTATISAFNGGVRGEASVSVALPISFGAPAAVVASPDTTLIPPPWTASRVLKARVVDAGGRTVPGQSFTWRIILNSSGYSLSDLTSGTADSVRLDPPYYGVSGRARMRVEVVSGAFADTVEVLRQGGREWTSIAMGSAHVCGTVWNEYGAPYREVYCWGDNSRGQLGRPGSIPDSPVPIRMPSDSFDITEVFAGDDYTCATTNTGGVYCWGSNEFGQLGALTAEICRGGVSCSREAVRAGAGLYVKVSAGPEHVCAFIRQSRFTDPPRVDCWGRNQDGQLGRNPALVPSSAVPAAIPGQPVSGFVRSLAAFGSTTCMSVAEVRRCVGKNSTGEFGLGTTTDSWTLVTAPTVPATLSDWTLWGGRGFLCGAQQLASDVGGDLISCWGRDDLGQTGLAPGYTRQDCSGIACVTGSITTPLPRPLYSGAPIRSGLIGFAVGAGHACVGQSQPNLLCWGDNSSGQFGNGTRTSSAVPGATVAMPGGSTIYTIHAGVASTCVYMDKEGLYCFGNGGSGRLGDGSRVDRLTPVRVVDP